MVGNTAQHVKAAAAKHDNLSLILKTYMVEGETYGPQVVPMYCVI